MIEGTPEHNDLGMYLGFYNVLCYEAIWQARLKGLGLGLGFGVYALGLWDWGVADVENYWHAWPRCNAGPK